MWWNPAALVAVPDDAGRRGGLTSSRRRSSSATTRRCRRSTSRWAATAAMPAAATSCRTCTSSCRSTRSGRSVSASTFRSASTTEYDDGWLGRYQALKSQIETINVNPALSWKITPNSRRRRRQLPVHQGHADQQRQLFGCAAHGAQTARRAGSSRLADVQRRSPARPPGSTRRSDVNGDDGAWGWNIGVAWDVTPAAAPRRELSLVDQVRRRRQHQLRQPGAAAAAAARSRRSARARRRRQQPGAVERRRDARTSSCRRSPTCRSTAAQPAVGDHGRRAVHATGRASRSSTFVSHRPRRDAAGDAGELRRHVAVSGGANYHLNDQWKVRGGVAFDQTPVTRPTARRGCPTPTAGGWRSAASTSGTQLEVRRRLRLHLRRQPELQPERREHGGIRPGQRHVRRETS